MKDCSLEPTPIYKLFLAGIQICLLAVECTVIHFTLMEFFKKDLSMPMRLWGAACIYLMIGLAVGSAYEIICVLEIQYSLADDGADEAISI